MSRYKIRGTRTRRKRINISTWSGGLISLRTLSWPLFPYLASFYSSLATIILLGIRLLGKLAASTSASLSGGLPPPESFILPSGLPSSLFKIVLPQGVFIGYFLLQEVSLSVPWNQVSSFPCGPWTPQNLWYPMSLALSLHMTNKYVTTKC